MLLWCPGRLVTRRGLSPLQYVLAGQKIPTPQQPARGVKTSIGRKNDLKWSRRAATNFDTLGAWNNRMELGVDLAQSIKSGKLVPEMSLDSVGVTSLIGRRQVNEDRYHMAVLGPQILMFALYDGHGGPQAADFAARKMENYIRSWLEKGEKDLQKILQEAFLEVNAAFLQRVKHLTAEENRNSGTTATVCLLRHSNELVVGFVGDSKALICREGKVVRLTQDHKPENPAEKARVCAAGGKIVSTSTGSPRVNGRLNMTRSIGDLDLKSSGVIADPQTRSIEVKHSRDAFLVLTTDGISNVISDQEIIHSLCSYHARTPVEAAHFITDQALHFGSEDNVTAMVIPFGAWGKHENALRIMPFRTVVGSRYA